MIFKIEIFLNDILKFKNENVVEKAKLLKDFINYLKFTLTESVYIRQSLLIRFILKNLTGVIKINKYAILNN